MKAYCTHRIHSTCFGHSCVLPQGGALQRTDTQKYDKAFKPTYWYKILIKIHDLKYILKIKIRIKSICDWF
jgi:hypothetical protein